MIDLSLILGKEVTFPLLCCFSYLLYRDLAGKPLVKAEEATSKPACTEHAQDIQINKAGSPKWNPIPLMKDAVEPIKDQPCYKPWNQTKPFPYKPFKPGEYRLNMGVRPIPLSDWLILEDTYKHRIETKWEIIKTNYKDVIYFLDPAMVSSSALHGNASVSASIKVGDAAFSQDIVLTSQDVENCRKALCELYEHFVGYLVKRFPQYFEVILSPSEESAGVFHNKILDEFHPVDPSRYLQLDDHEQNFIQYRCKNIEFIPSELTSPIQKKDAVGHLPLVTCSQTKRAHELILAMARMVEEDEILLLPNSIGQFNNEYVMMAGCFGFAAGFNPRERFLKPLTLVHGPVPEYKQNLQSQMNKFFHMHKQGKLVMRLNFSFQTHPKLYVTDDNKGADGEAIHAKTLEQLRGGRDLYYRSERQCLIKMGPTSNAMCFSIKTYLWNMADQFLADDFYSQPAVLEDLQNAITGMQGTMGHYKRRPEWGPALLTLLQKRLQNM